MMTNSRRIRMLLAKAGLDGHDRGAKVVARGLRDLGVEVIYTGIRQTPAAIVKAAMDEDVDVIGISILSGAHKYVVGEVMRLLREEGMDNVRVVVGGVIPEKDIPTLKAMGVSSVSGPGSSMEEIRNAIFVEPHSEDSGRESGQVI